MADAVQRHTSDPEKARGLYTTWSAERQQYLTRGHECAKLSIPSVMPTDQDQSKRNQEITIDQPWQSVGSSGVNTLTAKLVMTLYPSNSPFFQYTMGRKERQELLQLEGDEADAFAAKIEAKLQSMEQDVLEDMELSTLRTALFATVKHLLIVGNYCLYLGDDIKGFALNKFVCRRDASGNLLKLIVRELVDPKSLPDGFLDDIKATTPERVDSTQKNDIEIYTVVERQGKNKWVSWQEVFDTEVTGTRGTFNNDNNPWLVLRMIPVEGEDYGRSYCEELYGDLLSAENLTQAIVQGGMIASKLVWLVNPAGVTDEDDLQEASNGDFVPGKREDVDSLNTEKMADFQIAERVLQAVISRLERAFLMTASAQRQGERVTAYEISVMTQEIEDTLGGYYSILSQELQLPIVRRWTFKMQRNGSLPKLPAGSINPKIITGVDALGRGQDLTKLQGFVQDLVSLATLKPSIMDRLEDGDLIQRLANGRGIPLAGLIKSDEKMAQEQQQAQQQQMMQEAVSKGAGPMAAAAAQGTNGQPA
jgi:hypothetical protein